MINWEDEVNRICGEMAPAEPMALIAEQVDDLLHALKELQGGAQLAQEMERWKGEITTEMRALVAGVDQISYSNELNPLYYAAMSFVTWYLHDTWKTLRYPLPLQYMKVFAYIFLIAHEIGRSRCQEKGSDHGSLDH